MKRDYNLRYRDFSYILKNNGYHLVRQKGDHAIWAKNGTTPISINIREPNIYVMQRIVKKNNLKI